MKRVSQDSWRADQTAPLKGRNAGVVRIVTEGDEDHVGMGFMLDDRRLLTCAHVVNDALNRPRNSQSRPQEKVLVEFPLLPTYASQRARVVEWLPVERGNRAGDLAMLELDDALAEVGCSPLVDITGRSLDGDKLQVYGILAGERTGEHIAARFSGFARGALVQIDSADKQGRLIRPGFSGAGVYDEHEGAVIGMVQSVKVDVHIAPSESTVRISQAAQMLSVPQIMKMMPGLEVEERTQPAWLRAGWSVSASVLFLLSLSHLWVTQQGAGLIAALALETRHPQIAGFLGMHAVAVVGLLVAWILLRYARDFQLSHWSERIPPFPFMPVRWCTGPRRRMSWIVIVVFVLVPVYAEVHFVTKFHKEGQVWADRMVLGKAAWPAGASPPCLPNDGGNRYCQHPDATRYGWVTPASGAQGGYLNDVYRYGEPRDGLSTAAFTFFPGLQPLLVLGLAGAALTLLVRWGWALTLSE